MCLKVHLGEHGKCDIITVSPEVYFLGAHNVILGHECTCATYLEIQNNSLM